MPPGDKHPAADRCRVLLIGVSGCGKTGCLASLANAGYNLRVIDLDDGLDPLISYTRPEFRKTINYVTLQDQVEVTGSEMRPKGGIADAYGETISLLMNWVDDDVNLGPISSWGPEDVLVIDSGTRLAEYMVNHQMMMNPGMTRWEAKGKAVDPMHGLLNNLASGHLKCNIIFIVHVQPLEDAVTGRMTLVPSVGGKILPPKVGSFFNSMLTVADLGQGLQLSKVLRTVSDGSMALKNPAPQVIPYELPLELDADGYATGGMAKFFELVKAHATTEGETHA